MGASKISGIQSVNTRKFLKTSSWKYQRKAPKFRDPSVKNQFLLGNFGKSHILSPPLKCFLEVCMTMNTLCIWGQTQNYSQADTLPTTFSPWWESWLWNGKVCVRNVDTTLKWSNDGVREECEVGVLWISPSSNPWEVDVEKITSLYQISFIERIWEIKLTNHGRTDTMWAKGLKDWRRLSNSHKWGPDVFDFSKTLSLFHPYSPFWYCELFSWDQWDITGETVSFPWFLLFVSRNTRWGWITRMH